MMTKENDKQKMYRSDRGKYYIIEQQKQQKTATINDDESWQLMFAHIFCQGDWYVSIA